MANILYAKAKEDLLAGDIDLVNDTIKAVLVDSADYTVDASTDDALADIPAGARIATSSALTTKTVTGGAFDADDITFSSVSGDQAEALVLYKDTGSEATSRLIAYIDTGTGLPITPNGDNIVVVWDNGISKILSI